MSTQQPPRDPLPPESRAMLDRLDRWAERMIAKYPALAEAIRKQEEQEAQDDRRTA